jgi:Ca-activated chloride channel homolog
MMTLLDNYRFEWPWLLLALLALPLLAYLRGRRGAAPAIIFPTAFLFAGLATARRSRWGFVWPTVVLCSLASGIVALARPQLILSTEESKSEGIAICLTVDVSVSMNTEDFIIGGVRSNRITAAKRVMHDFIKGRSNDRIGIVAFAGAPYFPCPLTMDHDWLLTNIDRVQLGITGDGTAIGSGIATAARRLDLEKVAKSKVIVLITDGANNSGRLSPQDAARLAATLGIRIYTIAIGTSGQHLIPYRGQIINSGRQEFDEPTLQEVARIGNGQFFKAQDIDALERVFQNIDQLERSQVQRKRKLHTKDLFQWPAGLAAALLALGMIWRYTLGRTQPQE